MAGVPSEEETMANIKFPNILNDPKIKKFIDDGNVTVEEIETLRGRINKDMSSFIIHIIDESGSEDLKTTFCLFSDLIINIGVRIFIKKDGKIVNGKPKDVDQQKLRQFEGGCNLFTVVNTLCEDQHITLIPLALQYKLLFGKGITDDEQKELTRDYSGGHSCFLKIIRNGEEKKVLIIDPDFSENREIYDITDVVRKCLDKTWDVENLEITCLQAVARDTNCLFWTLLNVLLILLNPKQDHHRLLDAFKAKFNLDKDDADKTMKVKLNEFMTQFQKYICMVSRPALSAPPTYRAFSAPPASASPALAFTPEPRAFSASGKGKRAKSKKRTYRKRSRLSTKKHSKMSHTKNGF